MNALREPECDSFSNFTATAVPDSRSVPRKTQLASVELCCSPQAKRAGKEEHQRCNWSRAPSRRTVAVSSMIDGSTTVCLVESGSASDLVAHGAMPSPTEPLASSAPSVDGAITAPASLLSEAGDAMAAS
jgi:hypothetical protein